MSRYQCQGWQITSEGSLQANVLIQFMVPVRCEWQKKKGKRRKENTSEKERKRKKERKKERERLELWPPAAGGSPLCWRRPADQSCSGRWGCHTAPPARSPGRWWTAPSPARCQGNRRTPGPGRDITHLAVTALPQREIFSKLFFATFHWFNLLPVALKRTDLANVYI